MTTICKVLACGRLTVAREMCGRHYQRWAKFGDPIGPTLADKFWAKVNKTDTCWLWTATTNGKPGYGSFCGSELRYENGSRHKVLAHRFAYELLVGPIPAGMELDHLCRVRLCVNPGHLEPTDHRTNTLRGESPPALQARRMECTRGHPFDKIQGDGRRHCSICDREKEARRYIRRYGRIPKSNSRTISRLATEKERLNP